MLAHFANNAWAEIAQYISGGQEAEAAAESMSVSLADLGFSVIYGAAGIIITFLLILLFNYITRDKARFVPPISSVWNDVASILTHWPVIITAILYVFYICVVFAVHNEITQNGHCGFPAGPWSTPRKPNIPLVPKCSFSISRTFSSVYLFISPTFRTSSA